MLDYIDENGIDIMSAIFSLGVGLLKQAAIYEKWHIAKVLSEYSDVLIIDELSSVDLPNDEFDILGLIYQSYLQEGKKNIIGSYYTPQKIVYNMIKNFDFSHGELFFDPCCGSGAFLLSVTAENPKQLFGVDNDKVAVFISKVNMLLKYKDAEFVPQIYCFDFLMDCSVIQNHPVFEKKFDYIATNPPWGAMRDNYSNIYDDMFSGVTTKYVDIECGKNVVKNKFSVYTGGKKRTVDIKTIYETENLIFNLLSDDDISIVRIVKDKGKFSLQNSIWALGVVTGDNKRKIFSEYHDGMEKIYTGKDIQPYVLRPAQNYILYDRAKLQQVAKEEIYRSPEKLVYKFISNKLIFAYDNSASLFLNSANILIPDIPSMNTKTVMAFLNSALFQFMYIKLFGEVKILKGNLIKLPFPEISTTENAKISSLVDEVLSGDNAKQKVIEKFIFSIYGLTNEQINYVRRTVNEKAD